MGIVRGDVHLDLLAHDTDDLAPRALVVVLHVGVIPGLVAVSDPIPHALRDLDALQAVGFPRNLVLVVEEEKRRC